MPTTLDLYAKMGQSPLKIMTRIPLILSLLALMPASALAQNTWFVPDDFSTIQAGIDGSVNGDTVIVRDGTYVENINFNGMAITLKSENGPTTTIIDGNQAGSVVTFTGGVGSDAVFEGFTVTNGATGLGGGMFCESSSPTLENCTFTDNTANYGGGLYCWNNSFPTLDNCTFTNNTSVYYGGGMFCQESSNPTLNNCTFTDNTASWDGGGMYFYIYCFPTLNNCILWNNYALRGSEIYSSTLSSVAVTYSDVKGGWTGTGNIDADPLFVDPVNGDFHLQAGSPCIDTGDPNSPLDPDGTPADMGAFYFDQDQGGTISVSNLVAGQQALVEVHHATPNRYSHFAWSLRGGGPTFTPWGDAMVTAPFHVKIMPTDATGHASYIADVPVSAAGLTVWCHGTDAGTQSMLNALTLVIQ